jgi:hypothetical protein
MDRKMNNKEKKIFVITAVLILATLLFPPFSYYGSDGVTMNMGYSFILSPPSYGGGRVLGIVNVGLLFMQWLGILLVTGISIYLVREK